MLEGWSLVRGSFTWKRGGKGFRKSGLKRGVVSHQRLHCTVSVSTKLLNRLWGKLPQKKKNRRPCRAMVCSQELYIVHKLTSWTDCVESCLQKREKKKKKEKKMQGHRYVHKLTSWTDCVESCLKKREKKKKKEKKMQGHRYVHKLTSWTDYVEGCPRKRRRRCRAISMFTMWKVASKKKKKKVNRRRCRAISIFTNSHPEQTMWKVAQKKKKRRRRKRGRKRCKAVQGSGLPITLVAWTKQNVTKNIPCKKPKEWLP